MFVKQRFSAITLVQTSLFILLLVLLLILENDRSLWLIATVFVALVIWHFYSGSRIKTVQQQTALRFLYIGVYFCLCTMLIWLTRGEEESPLWIVFFLPIILSASILSLRQTLLVCCTAVVLFVSHLPTTMFENESLRSEIFPEMLGFCIMFFLVGALVQDFAQRHRQQLLQIEQAEKQLRASERLASLGELSAGIAHEIRNPLGIISSSAQMLETKNVSEPDRQLLDIIQEESNRLNALIKDFLFFGRPLEPHFEVCDLGTILSRQIEALQVTAQQRGVQLTLSNLLSECQASVDTAMIQQVMLNLLLNALDATAVNGHVRVRLVADQDSVRFTVEDDGGGIAEEHIGRIFDPFFTTKGHGTGLGLANCYKIIQSHGGAIQVNSQLDRGTSMTVILPALGV